MEGLVKIFIFPKNRLDKGKKELEARRTPAKKEEKNHAPPTCKKKSSFSRGGVLDQKAAGAKGYARCLRNRSEPRRGDSRGKRSASLGKGKKRREKRVVGAQSEGGKEVPF